MDSDITMTLGNYLEALVRLGGTPTVSIRPIDLASYLGVSKPSVCSAMSTLRRKDLADQPYRGSITLTQRGYETGLSISQRHDLAKRFLSEVLLLNESQVDTESNILKYAIEDDSLSVWTDYVTAQLAQRCQQSDNGD